MAPKLHLQSWRSFLHLFLPVTFMRPHVLPRQMGVGRSEKKFHSQCCWCSGIYPGGHILSAWLLLLIGLSQHLLPSWQSLPEVAQRSASLSLGLNYWIFVKKKNSQSPTPCHLLISTSACCLLYISSSKASSIIGSSAHTGSQGIELSLLLFNWHSGSKAGGVLQPKLEVRSQRLSSGWLHLSTSGTSL